MIEIRGAQQLAHLSKQLKEAGAKDLERELSKGIRLAIRPLITEIRNSARETLPKRGGLAEKIAKSQIRIVRRRGGIRLQAKNAYALRRLDRGTGPQTVASVRHPVFHTGKWVTQRVNPGWWSKPTERMAPEIRAGVDKAMKIIADKIGHRL